MIVGLLLIVFSLGGCYGWIYTNTVEPYCLDMDATSTAGASTSSSLKQVAIPRIPGARAMWSSNAIGDAVKKEGITKIHYCDKKTFRILGGLWGSDAIIVYGE